MNKPLTRSQVKALPKGYNITRAPIGMDSEGNPLFYPNRQQRRLMLKEDSGRNKVVQKIVMKVAEDKYKSKPRDITLHKTVGTVKGIDKVILIVQRTVFHLKQYFK